MSKREWGQTICAQGKRHVLGERVQGKEHSVNIPLRCPLGTKLVGVNHSHPGGSLRLSDQDIRTARDKGLKLVCVKAKSKSKCYRFGR